jgi:glycosyltransferase involved in cell wall biosynthesis
VSSGSIIQVTLWNSPYLGNFMCGELAMAAAVRERFGLGTHFVLDHGAAGQPWLADLDAAGITWSVLPGDKRAWRRSLRGAIEHHNGVLVHAHFTAADLQAAAVAHRAGVPCVWHLRTGFAGYPLRQRVKDLVKMRLIARARVQRILAVSPWLGEFARRRGAPADRVVVLPNPTVFERFERLPDRSAARARLHLDEQATVLLAFGWWPEVKGVDLLFDATAALVERHPRLQLLLVGEQKMRDFLDERIGSPPPWLRLSPFVEDPAWLYAAADLFVSASRHEGQSSAIGEALACGLPVIMSDIPGTAPWGQAPHILDFLSENVEALGAQLERVLTQSGEERRRAGEENRAWSREHASLASWTERLCSIYAEVLDECSPTSSGHRAAHQHASRDGEVAGGQLTQRK